MSIQQDINSALGQVGVLAALNPTLQARAKEGEEIRKIKNEGKAVIERNKTLNEDMEAESKKLHESAKKASSPEELKKLMDDSTVKMKLYGQEMGEMIDKLDDLTRRGYDISPKKFKGAYFDLRKKEMEKEAKAEIAKRANETQAKLAKEAQQRAEQIAKDKALAKKKRQEYMSNLYKGVNRTMQGFKDMSREQQEKIIKKITPGDRRKIANEEKWRNQIYGK